MLRFAASPTGDMHIGDLRVAIVNYLVAQQQNKPFIIRIDDTNKALNIEGKDTEIMQILEKFALIHHSVFHQSEHQHMHQTLAIKLLEEGKAFVCTCTQNKIQADKKKAKETNSDYHYSGCCEKKDQAEHAKLKESGSAFVLRIKKPSKEISFHDTIQGNQTFTPQEIDSFIILNEDGTPTPVFASACDDMLHAIGNVILEKNAILDSARQIYIKSQLGFDEQVKYAHLPHIIDCKDACLVKWLFEQGFIPDAIINYLVLLGYKDAPQKVFTLPEAISWFTLENLSNISNSFDLNALRHLNREHLKRIEDKQLSSLFGFADTDVGKLLKLYLNEASTINELALKIRPIFAPKVLNGAYEKEMKIIQKIIMEAPMIENYDDFKSYILKKSGIQTEMVNMALRHLLTGVKDAAVKNDPELDDIYPLIKSYLLEVIS